MFDEVFKVNVIVMNIGTCLTTLCLDCKLGEKKNDGKGKGKGKGRKEKEREGYKGRVHLVCLGGMGREKKESIFRLNLFTLVEIIFLIKFVHVFASNPSPPNSSLSFLLSKQEIIYPSKSLFFLILDFSLSKHSVNVYF